MRRRDFQRLVDSLKSLSPHQLHQLNETVSGLAQKNEVRALIARQVEQSGQCPYCDAKEFRRWGTTSAGEQRYRCKSCARTFTGLTGTPLNRVHHKHQLLDYEHCMKVGLSVREAAAELGLHRNVVFRWRHRLMPQLDVHQPHSLEGVAEFDEAFFRESFKGRKHGMLRKAHKRAMPAGKRAIGRIIYRTSTPSTAASRTGSRPSREWRPRTCLCTWPGSGSSTKPAGCAPLESFSETPYPDRASRSVPLRESWPLAFYNTIR